MKKLALVFGSVASCLALAFGCSSSDDAAPGPKDDGSDASQTTDTGGPTDSGPNKPDAVNTSDANFDANSIDAPEVTIDYLPTCPTLTPCDSDPVGVWKTTGGCVSASVFDSAKQSCAGLQESNVSIKAKGVVTITATQVSRQAEVKLSAHLQVPKSCAAPISDCGLIAIGLKQQKYGGFDTSSCTDDGANCQCDVTKAILDNSTGTYTKSGGVLTTDANEKYNYCVDAGKLTYQKLDSNGDPELAQFTAAK